MKRFLASLFLLALTATAWGHGVDAPLYNPTFRSLHMDSLGAGRVAIRAKIASAGGNDTLEFLLLPVDSCMHIFPGGAGSTSPNFLYYTPCNSNDTIPWLNATAYGDDSVKFLINEDTTAILFLSKDSIIIRSETGAHIVFKSPDVLSVQADTVGKTNILGYVTIVGSLRLMVDTATTGDVRMFLPYDSTHVGGPTNGQGWFWNTGNGQFELSSPTGGGGTPLKADTGNGGQASFALTDTTVIGPDSTTEAKFDNQTPDTLSLTVVKIPDNAVTGTGKIAQHAVDTSDLSVSNLGAADAFLTNNSAGSMEWADPATVGGAGITVSAGPIFNVGSDSTINVSATGVGVVKVPDNIIDSNKVINGSLTPNDLDEGGAASDGDVATRGATGGDFDFETPTGTGNLMRRTGVLALADSLSIVPALHWTYAAATADADPGPGVMRFNNVSVAAATFAYVDDQVVFNSMAIVDSTVSKISVSDILFFFVRANTSKRYVFRVTADSSDGTGYWKLAIAHVANGGIGFDVGDTVCLSIITHAAQTSNDLALRLLDETGSGAAVFGTSPTLATPTINGATGTGTQDYGEAAMDFTGGGSVTFDPNEVLEGEINQGSLDSTELQDNGISTIKLQDTVVTYTKLDSDAVDSNKIVDKGVRTADLQDTSVTTGKIDTHAVDTSKMDFTNTGSAGQVVTKAAGVNGQFTWATSGGGQDLAVDTGNGGQASFTLPTGTVFGPDTTTQVKFEDQTPDTVTVTVTGIPDGAVSSAAKIVDGVVTPADLDEGTAATDGDVNTRGSTDADFDWERPSGTGRLARVSGNLDATNWTFSTTTTDADPGAGTMRFNNASMASASFAYLDTISFNSIELGDTTFAWISNGDLIYFYDLNDPTNACLFKVTGLSTNGTGYWKVPITIQDSATTGQFTASDTVVAVIRNRVSQNGVYGIRIANTHGAADYVYFSSTEFVSSSAYSHNIGSSGTPWGQVFANSATFDLASSGYVKLPARNNPNPVYKNELIFDTNTYAIAMTDAAVDYTVAQKIKSVQAYVPDPDNQVNDTIPLLYVRTGLYPGGITLDSVGFVQDEATSYTVVFIEGADFNTTITTVESVTASTEEAANSSALDDASIAAGSVLMAVIPNDARTKVLLWVTYRVNVFN